MRMSNSSFQTKDSGARELYPTGSQRDTQEGKPRYDLIGKHGLKRLAELMARGAKKYGEHNWKLGQPVSRSYASAFRHLMQWAAGDRSEDHLAAVVFNIFSIIHVEEQVKVGKLPTDLLDMDIYEEPEFAPMPNMATLGTYAMMTATYEEEIEAARKALEEWEMTYSSLT